MSVVALRSAPVEPPLPPLSAVRAELARASAALAEAMATFNAAAVPLNRLAEVEHQAQRVAARLAELRGDYDRRVAEWIAGGRDGTRPAPSGEQLATEEQHAELAADAASARSLLPERHAVLEQAHAVVVAAQDRHAEALCLVAIEAADEFIQGSYLPALAELARLDATLFGLVDELMDRGRLNGASEAARTAALKAGAEIRQLLGAAANVQRTSDRSAGRQVLEALSKDPGSSL